MTTIDLIIVFLAFALALSTLVIDETGADDIWMAGDLEERDGKQ